MEHVFYLTHLRLISWTLYFFPTHKQRKIIEYICLSSALFSLATLIFLHRTYISSHDSKPNCLNTLFHNITDHDHMIIHDHLHIKDDIKHEKSEVFLTNTSYAIVKLHIIPSSSYEDKDILSIRYYDTTENMIDRDHHFTIDHHHHFTIDHHHASSSSVSLSSSSSPSSSSVSSSSQSSSCSDNNVLSDDIHDNDDNNMDINTCTSSSASSSSSSLSLYFDMSNLLWLDSPSLYIYAMEKDLILPPKHGDYAHPMRAVRIYDVIIPKSHICMGDSIARRMLSYMIGYDTAVINWAIASFGARGYVYNYYSQELFSLNIAFDFISLSINPLTIKSPVTGSIGYPLDMTSWLSSSIIFDILRLKLSSGIDALQATLASSVGTILLYKVGVVVTTISLFFTTSTIVSFMLRETQQRMLKFTFMLQHHISNRIPIASLVFTHLVETLVFIPIMIGIVFLMFQFFKDQILTFLVWSLVWSSEVFSVLSLRTRASIQYFPRIFLCYFSLFHIYYFSRPFGFSYLALWTTFLLLFHAMVHFFYQYEIPAVIHGTVSVNTPRNASSSISSSSMTSSSSSYDWYNDVNILSSPINNVNNVNNQHHHMVASAAALLSSITLSAQHDEMMHSTSSSSTSYPSSYPSSSSSTTYPSSSLPSGIIGNRIRSSSANSTSSTSSTSSSLSHHPPIIPRLIVNTSSLSTSTSPFNHNQHHDARHDHHQDTQHHDAHDDDNASLMSINSFRGLYTPERRQQPRRRSFSHGHYPSSTPSSSSSSSYNQPSSLLTSSQMMIDHNMISPSTPYPSSSLSSSSSSSSSSFYQQSEHGSVPVLGAILGANMSSSSIDDASSPKYYSTVTSYNNLSSSSSSSSSSRPSSTRHHLHHHNILSTSPSSSGLSAIVRTSSDDIDVREQRYSDDYAL